MQAANDLLVLSEVHERIHEVLDDLIKDVDHGGSSLSRSSSRRLELILIVAHCKLFELFRVLDDIIDRLLLLVLLNIWLVLKETVSHKLVHVVVVSQVDPGLV